MIDEWSGFADLLANLIEKYASELDVENLPAPAVRLRTRTARQQIKKNLFSSRKQLQAKLLHDIIDVIQESKQEGDGHFLRSLET